MLNYFSIAATVGTVLGFLAGLGVGGGSLLMLWLTLVLGLPHNIARSINLLFFIPTALISSLFRKKQGDLHFKNLLPAMVSATLAAAAGSLAAGYLNVSSIKKVFGALLIFAGIRELIHRPRNAK